MTQWFGETWGAPVCDPADHTDTPIGERCIECACPINAGDQGMLIPDHVGNVCAYHRVCFLRTVLPCEMWTPEMLENLPRYWADHRRDCHGA